MPLIAMITPLHNGDYVKLKSMSQPSRFIVSRYVKSHSVIVLCCHILSAEGEGVVSMQGE